MDYYIFHAWKRGKQRWAYWYYDASMKRRQVFVNPETGEPFGKKDDVKRYLAVLRKKVTSAHPSLTIEQLGKVMFADSSDWSIRRGRKRGKPVSPQTLETHRILFNKYILDRWGKLQPALVRGRAFEEYLYTLNVSQSTRRSIGQTMGLILKEAASLELIDAIPRIELPSRERVARVALTLDELMKLFPAEQSERLKVWLTSKKDTAYVADLACAMNAAMFFAGLRPQEARALHRDQLDLEQQIIFVTAAIDNKDIITPYLKTSTLKDPRHRFTFVGKRGAEILKRYVTEYHIKGLLFTIDGTVVNRTFARKRLQRAAKAAKVNPAVVPYSGRYTYETLLRGGLDKHVIMLLMGHRTDSSPDEYDRPQLEQRAEQMRSLTTVIDKAFADKNK